MLLDWKLEEETRIGKGRDRMLLAGWWLRCLAERNEIGKDETKKSPL